MTLLVLWETLEEIRSLMLIDNIILLQVPQATKPVGFLHCFCTDSFPIAVCIGVSNASIKQIQSICV